MSMSMIMSMAKSIRATLIAIRFYLDFCLKLQNPSTLNLGSFKSIITGPATLVGQLVQLFLKRHCYIH